MAAIAGTGAALRALELDVTDEEPVERADATVIAEQGRLDAVVHNAGHCARPGSPRARH